MVEVGSIDYNKIAKKIEDDKRKAKTTSYVDGGKIYYKKNCEYCHGAKGEILSSGTSRALSKMSFEEMQDAMSGYINDEYDNGMAILMKPYADLVVKNDLEKISVYLESINK